jgi:signal peptidase I
MLKLLKVFLLVLLSLIPLISITGMVLWQRAGLRFYDVQTASMSPLVQTGDLVLTVKTDSTGLKAGDVISFTNSKNGLTVTHRIKQMFPEKDFIVTKGDNLPTVDPPIAYRAVKGKVVKVVPKAGYILSFLRRPLGLITAVYLPSLLISAIELSRVVNIFSKRAYGLPEIS